MKFFDDKNLYYLASPHNMVSVFDSTRYDRSDIDCLNNAQRDYLIKHLAEHGFVQKKGSELYHPVFDISVIFPKITGLGISPYRVIETTRRRPGDIFALTPAQMACVILANFSRKDQLLKLKDLIDHQPFNLKKLLDTTNHESFFDDYRGHYRELLHHQQKVIKTDQFVRKNHLGAIF